MTQGALTDPSRVRALVQGTVQGVGFRVFVRRAAEDLGLGGWVRNRRDGAVELEAEGSAAAIESLLAAVRRGPAGAWVREVHVDPIAPTGARPAFVVRAGDHPGD
jgi:acylphosphatase